MSNKKGPISKADKFYIEQHCNESTVESIAETLNRSVVSVEKYISKYRKSMGTAGRQIATSSGATIMTQSASEISDDFKMNRSARTSSRTKDCVTTIKREDD